VKRRALISVSCLLAGLLAGSVTTGSAQASPSTTAKAAPVPTAADQTVPQQRRAAVLGANWQYSTDKVWSLLPGPDGLSVLAGDVANGAAMQSIATVSVSGVASRQWIGQACLMRGSHVAAVVFGPVEYISTASLFDRGAFAALVDLDTGAVKYLPGLRPTYSYFSPKCGATGAAEFTSFGTGESATTLTSVSRTGATSTKLAGARGEITDLTATADGRLVGAHGNALVTYRSNGQATVLAKASSQVYGVQAAAGGTVVYASDTAGVTEVHALSKGRSIRVAHGPAGTVGIDATATRGISVHGTGLSRDATVAGLSLGAAPKDFAPSLGGTNYAEAVPPTGTRGVTVRVSSTAGAQAEIAVPAQRLRPASRSASMSPSAITAVTSSSTTDANLPCAIKRNDVNTEAYQPSPQQVEWAVDQAVTGHLTGTHPSNYRHYGLPSFAPQGVFPPTALSGGGSVPPQVMLGVLANESNLWQASSHVAQGGYGNELTGNIYGRSGDALTINFSNADCGYGIAQVTDGMRTGQQSATVQREIALDYQTNIAAGMNILIGKWNQLKGLGITMNDGTPSAIENWYGALWAYNSGLQPDANNGNTSGCSPSPSCTDSAGYWGLGWFNNPANPIYPANRHIFNSVGTDAASPSKWPYQERVIGWAAYPIYEPNGSYSQAYWLSDKDRIDAIPNPALFCDSNNHCSGASTTSQGSCALSNLHCWIHHSVTWKGACATNGTCGYGQSAYSAGAAEPGDPTSTDPADCSRGTLPSNAVIVDDTSSVYSPCGGTATSGSFNFTFTADSNGNYPAHIDLHQINGGQNGHYWFTHTVQQTGVLPATGTWHFPTTVNGWGKVMVHVPAQGAQTYQAHYTITDGSSGATRTRVINTDYGQNAWISLGSMHLGSNSTISLSSLSVHDNSSDVAWDAVAFVPGSKPAYKVVALGDSYSSGEGDPPFDSIPNGNDANGCHRATGTYSRQLKMPGQSTPAYTNSADELDLLACSGAHSVSIASQAVNSAGQENPYDTHWGSADYQNGQELQLDQGFADADTNLVTLTIGGNDARFADVVKQCYGGGAPFVGNCSDPGQVMSGDTQELRTIEPHVIRDLLPAKLTATYNAIHAAAPNATILVGGYPKLFTPDGDDNLCFGIISKTDKLWLNSMGDLMNSTLSSAVAAVAATGVKIHYVDPTPTFSGHEECTSDPWVNGLDPVHLEYSFHPNAEGQTYGYTPQFQAAVNAYLP
jgi:hypothetical protein